MDAVYRIDDLSEIYSPALVFYPAVIRRNIARAVAIANDPSRLRPHVKTHKTREIVQLAMQAGITKHKCATIAEAEMLASCQVKDVLIAYPMVGPNCQRLARLAGRFPRCSFSVVADDMRAVRALAEAMQAAGQQVGVLLDIDVGQHRTGIAPGESAVALYETIASLPALRPEGLHVYDGHNHHADAAVRAAAVSDLMRPVLKLRDALTAKGLSAPRLVVAGTPTFSMFARMSLPGLELSPGTCFVYDHGYGRRFADLSAFAPAALLVTRVVSRPTPERVTLDLGTKAVASDPPVESRCALLDLPDARVVVHNEEHLVVETPRSAKWLPGDVVFGVPTHICPTCALHRQAYVVEDGKLVGRWEIAARDRMLTV